MNSMFIFCNKRCYDGGAEPKVTTKSNGWKLTSTNEEVELGAPAAEDGAYFLLG